MVLTPLEANINQTTTPTVLHLTIKEWHYCSHRLLTRVFHTYVEPTTHFIQILHVDYVVSRDTTNRTAPSLSTWRDIESIMTPLSALSLAPGRYVMLVGHGVSINMQPLTASILYGYYWTVSLRTIFLATNCFWKMFDHILMGKFCACNHLVITSTQLNKVISDASLCGTTLRLWETYFHWQKLKKNVESSWIRPTMAMLFMYICPPNMFWNSSVWNLDYMCIWCIPYGYS